jgi:hypothetical protein
MKKLVAAAAVAASLTLIAPQAIAVENGKSAIGSDRIININIFAGSGFLYDDRIIFTQAHTVVYNGALQKLDWFRVSPPGTKITSGKDTYKVKKIFVAEGYKDWDNKVNWARTNDFAIVILEKPIKKVAKAKLVTKEQIDALMKAGASVTSGGYGFQSLADRQTRRNAYGISPKQGTWNFVDPSLLEKQIPIWAASARMNREPFPEHLKYHLAAPYGGPDTCDGDSGSGYFIEDKKTKSTLYLGTPGPGLGKPNCRDEPEIPNFTPLIGIDPVYQFDYLIKRAEAWVKKH